jgi:leader peptidase (prepilin peptidase)/N-methyltransferase
MVAVYALVGILAGAVVNFCADQFPYGGKLRKLPYCPYCDQPRSPWAWISTLAYLRFGPQCQYCGALVPLRYPLVELGMAALFALLRLRFDQPRFLGLYSAYTMILVLVLVVDLEHHIIPNAIIYPAWGLAFLGSLLHPEAGFPLIALIGGVIGLGLLLVAHWLGQLFVKVASRCWDAQAEGPALGLGDAKLGGFIGLILGVPQVLTALVIAILLGGLVAGLYWLVHAVLLQRYKPFTALPYGPYLAAGAMITMLFAPDVSCLVPTG